MFTGIFLRIYVFPDFMFVSGLYTGELLSADFDMGSVDLELGFEWQPVFFESSGVTFYFEKWFSAMYTFGIRYYFGGGKTLINRHRYDTLVRMR